MSKSTNKNVIIVDKPKVIDVEQQLLVSERDDLLEAETGYKRRIEHLEQESADMLRNFDILYNENKLLRSKLEMPDGAGVDKVESYNSVFKERQHFREANRAFKRRIKQLEDDAEDSKKGYEELEIKYQLLTQKAQLQTEYATKSKDEKIGELIETHDELNKKVAMFIKEREQYEERITEMTKTERELQSKCDGLETDRHELKIRCDLLQSDRELLKDKVADLEAKIPDPEIKAKEEQQYLGLQAQVAALQVANKDATYEIHKYKEEIRVLNKTTTLKVETIDKASSALDGFDVENKKEKEENLEKQTQLEEELVQSKDAAMLMLKQNDQLKSDNELAENTIADLKLEVERLEEDIKAKESQIVDMSGMVKTGQSLNDDYSVMQDKLKDMIATKQALENELLQEKRLHKLKVVEMNNEISKTGDALKQLQNEHARCEHDAKKLQHENDALQKLVDAQAIELRNMKSQLEQVQTLLEEKSSKYEEMKTTEKEAVSEMNSNRLELHTVKRQLEDLRNEKRGNFGILKKEMETAKVQREEETEKLRKETTRMKEEIKSLKGSEHKLSMMEAEIGRLLLRLKRTDKFRKPPMKTVPGSSGPGTTVTVDKEEMMQLRKKQREVEKERNVLLQEKRQWEILKEKYVELQQTAKRLNNENKRVRGNLDGTESKVEVLQNKLKLLNVNTDAVPGQNDVQLATYVDKNRPDGRKHALVKKMPRIAPIPEHRTTHQAQAEPRSHYGKADQSTASHVPEIGHGNQTLDDKLQSARRLRPLKVRKRIEKKSPELNPRGKNKRAVLPEVHSTNDGPKYGKGYKDIHKSRYKSSDFALSLL